jgi:hypothetical protein
MQEDVLRNGGEDATQDRLVFGVPGGVVGVGQLGGGMTLGRLDRDRGWKRLLAPVDDAEELVLAKIG